MATTNYREDRLGRDLLNPTTDAKDHLGRRVNATTGPDGGGLRRILRPASTAVAVNLEVQVADGKKYVVVTAGTTGVSDPSPPAVGATVADGSAVLRRQR